MFTMTLLVATIVSVVTSIAMVIGALTGATHVFVDQEPDLTMFNHYLLGQSIGIPAWSWDSSCSLSSLWKIRVEVFFQGNQLERSA